MANILWDALYYDLNKEHKHLGDQKGEFVFIVNPLILEPRSWSSFYMLGCLQSLILFVFLKKFLSRNKNKIS